MDVFGSRSAIEAHQLQSLQRLVTAIVPANRFHTSKLQKAQVPTTFSSLKEFSDAVPFTSKDELVEDQRQNPPYGSNLTFPLAQYTRYHQTSGTTATPLRWLDTAESWEWMLESWTAILKATGVSRSDRLFFAFSYGPFIGFWLGFEAAARLGALVIPGGGMTSAARLRCILDNEVTVLCCTPTYALRLAEVARSEEIGLDRSRVRRLLVAGEPGGSIPATRSRIQEAWPNADVFDHHGMTEVGPVTYQCPTHPGVLHVLEAAYFAEVVDPKSGRPVAEKEVGELVLTTLGRTGSPLLRYRTGDLVRPGRCQCGRSELALQGGIIGRVDDMVVVRGVNVYPSAIEQIVRETGGVTEYRVHVNKGGALPELTVEIEPEPQCDATTLKAKLENDLQTALSLRIPVITVPTGKLPRFEMKASRWVR